MAHTKESLEGQVRLYNAYYRWLCDIVMYQEMKRSGRNYKKLLKAMKEKQFTVVVDNDVNRAEDGKYLRYTFYEETGIEGEIKGSCSFLEMCVGLSVRINSVIFEPDPSYKPARWFWMMMENCGLDKYTDEQFDPLVVNKVMDRVILRRYSKTGKGGLFPLKHPNKDQTEVEIWYQMQQYVMENFDY